MEYTLKELVAKTGVTLRTIRLWIHRGLLPRPIGKGPGARYVEDHVRRIEMIAHLRKAGHELEPIRKAVVKMSERELRALYEDEPKPARTKKREPAAAKAPPVLPAKEEALARPHDALPGGQTWVIVGLLPKLALMLGDDASPLAKRIAAEICEKYRQA